MNPSIKDHRWLVVDDDQILLELTAAVLRSVPGSEVVACDDARTALKICFAEPGSFELVLTDFNMPGMDGIELARAVRRIAGAAAEAVCTEGAARRRAVGARATTPVVGTKFARVSRQAVRSAKLCVTPRCLRFL